jgi:signal transduction histidine kinase
MANTTSKYRSLIVPAILVVALVVLAALQMVWLKDLSEGQRERMQENVEIGAARLAEELTDILQSAHAEFQFIDLGNDSTDAITRTVTQIWDEWKTTAEYPQLMETIYIVQKVNNDSQLVSVIGDGSTKEVSDEKRQLITALASKTPNVPGLDMVPNLSTVFGDESAIIVHAIDPGSFVNNREMRITASSRVDDVLERTQNAVNQSGTTTARTTVVRVATVPTIHLVLAIDSSYLKNSVIPSLTEKHLMYDGSVDYKIAIAKIDSLSTRLFYGDNATSNSLAQSDAVIPITRPKEVSFFIMNTGANILIRNRTSQVSEPALRDSQRQSFSYSFQMSDHDDTISTSPLAFNQAGLQASLQPAWNLYVRHNLGSVDRAASQFRRNTSLLSFGIMSILAIGFILIFRNNTKANELARQQMEFVAGVSHELRTPLSVIRSASDNMTAGLIKDEEGAKRYGSLIHTESMRLNDLIEQVLEFSGIQSGQRRYEYKPLVVHRLVMSSLKGLGDRIDPESVTLNLSFDQCPNIMADVSGLTSVVQNLVINAVKYSKGEPIVGIKIYNVSKSGKPAVCVDVSDNGQGIPHDELDKVFDPFYRARGIRDQQVKGNGLGLSIVKSIMEQHDGSVSVKSTPGEGSTFTLTFNWLEQQPLDNVRR